jgi:hypothetical protein
MKRHTCIICKTKCYDDRMVNVFGKSWACESHPKYHGLVNPCYCNEDIYIARQILDLSKQLKHISLKHLVNS